MEELLLVWSVILTILFIVGIVWILDLQRRLRWLQRRREEMFVGAEEDAGLAAAVENLAARLSETNARTERRTSKNGPTKRLLNRTTSTITSGSSRNEASRAGP